MQSQIQICLSPPFKKMKIVITNKLPQMTKNCILILCNEFGDILSIDEEEDKVIVEFRKNEDAKSFVEKMEELRPFNLERKLPRLNVFVDRIPKKYEINEIAKFFSDILTENKSEENSLLVSKHREIRKIKQIRTYYTFQAVKVKFRREEDAIRFIEKVDRKEKIDGSLLVAKFYSGEKNVTIVNTDDRCVFVYNLPDKYTDKELFDFFSTFGQIKTSRVSNNKAYVNYDDELSALKAIKYADGILVRNKKINCVIKSQRKGRKRNERG